MAVQLPQQGKFAVGLTWDQHSQHPSDLDLACVAIGPTGLVLDACFYNNRTALQGALTHSGDFQSTAESGICESITVDTALLSNSGIYAIVFCLMKPNSGDFTGCASASLHLYSPETQQGLMQPVALGPACPLDCSFSVLSICRRTHAGTLAFETCLYPFPPPARNFMDVLPAILGLVNIDPGVAAETKQPVFRLTKNSQIAVPVGMNKVCFGLGWNSDVDVDASCVGFNKDGFVQFGVYYGDQSWGKVVQHSGDCRDGDESKKDDEQIVVNFELIPRYVDAFFFVINIYSGGSFKNVKDEYCRLVDQTKGPNKGAEIFRFQNMDSCSGSGIVMIGLYRNLHFPDQWLLTTPAHPASGNWWVDTAAACQHLHAQFRNGGTSNWASKGSTIVSAPKETMDVKITVVGAEGVTAMDKGGTSDPYCIVKDQFRGDKIHTTKTHKKTVDPIWGSDFVVDAATLRNLNFKIFDKDLFKDDKIGKAKFKIPVDNLPYGQEIAFQVPIKNKKGQPAGKLNLKLERKYKNCPF